MSRVCGAMIWLAILCGAFPTISQAGLIAGLSEIVKDNRPGYLEADIVIKANAKFAARSIDNVNIDMVGSQINGTQVTVAQFVAGLFSIELQGPFAPWQDGFIPGQNFGELGGDPTDPASDVYASRASNANLDPIGSPILADQDYLFATIYFDYVALGLTDGDSVTFDILGTRENDLDPTILNPNFSTGADIGDPTLIDPTETVDFDYTVDLPSARTFVFGSVTPPPPPPPPPSAIPEPSSLLIALTMISNATMIRRRKKRFGSAGK